MYRLRYIFYIVFIGLVGLVGIPNASAQNWGTGTETDPYNVDVDLDRVHTWGAASYGQEGKTLYYKLVGDCTIMPNSDWSIYTFVVGAGTVVFDLNGYELKLYNAVGANNANAIGKSLFKVEKGAKLIIKSGNEGGKLVGIDGSSPQNTLPFSHAASIVVYGELEFQSGAITDFVRSIELEFDANKIINNSAELGCALFIGNGGKVTMSGGSISNCGFDITRHYDANGVILGNDIKHKGGAVYVEQGGLFNLTGGTISDCNAFNGGAVFVEAPKSSGDLGENTGFKMSGGTISNCTASRRGGGVYVDASSFGRSRFAMSGGTIIKCKAEHSGAGVCVSGLAKMSGGTISYNELLTAYKKDSNGNPDYSQQAITTQLHAHGNGVFLYGRVYNDDQKKDVELPNKATFEMTGGTISNNVSCSGGGIMAFYNSRLVLDGEGVLLSENHAMGAEGTGNGGAIYVQDSEFEFSAGTLRGNYARRYGGGININATAASSLILDGKCTIEDNIAGHGGGISQEAGICYLSINSDDVSIFNNKARGVAQDWTDNDADGNYGWGGNGGGIFIEQGTLNIGAGNIINNKAGGDGGGISLRAERLNGGITFNMTGGTVSGNYSDFDDNSSNKEYNFAPGNGGGLSVYNNPANASSGETTNITISLGTGSITGNQANNGAGIHVYSHLKSGVTNNVNMFLGSNGTGIGGVSIVNNKANNNGNGGGITLENGNITMYKGNIERNSAYNGAGICLMNGSFTVTGSDSYISNNIATQNGGGLYVVNKNTGTAKSVTFTGGTFTNNRAKNGGGICVEGNIGLSATGTTLNSNRANNGGGIYMLKGGINGSTSMTYTGGLITSNTAIGMPDSQTTSYNNDANNIGVGGGVYLAAGTSLTFNTGTNPLGLYGNTAAFAADDIYANGVNTSLVLPNVSAMKLDGFDIPTTELYWVEDYVSNDTQYSKGTKIGGDNPSEIIRYRDALKNLKDIRKIGFSNGATSITYNNGEYICLALGYELYYVTLIKKGLKVGESAVFDVAYQKDGNWVNYRKVLFPCMESSQEGDGGVKAVVVLPAGMWKFSEDGNWSWKYSETSAEMAINSEEFEKLNGSNFQCIFTNTSTGNTILSDEDVVVNKLQK